MFREVKLLILGTLAALAMTQTALAKDTFKDMDDFNYVLSKGILQGMIAKELCSCRYVVGLSVDECKKRSSLPDATFSVLTVMDDPAKKRVTVYPAVPISSVPAMAIFDKKHPRKGCMMAYGMKDATTK